MSDTSNLSTCQIINWGLALLSGVLVLWTTYGAVGFFAALLLGLAFAVFFGLVMNGLVCTGYRAEDRGIEARDVAATLRKMTGITGYKAPDDEEDAPTTVASPAQSAVVVAKAEVVSEVEVTGTRPNALSAPRGAAADDLKRIKGVGPKLEVLCHELGFYHFDQIAGWSAAEVAWVDENLKGFKGRVSRDNWVDQAKTLAAGGETEFSKRVMTGGGYEE